MDIEILPLRGKIVLAENLIFRIEIRVLKDIALIQLAEDSLFSFQRAICELFLFFSISIL